jgi:hypothetical protein
MMRLAERKTKLTAITNATARYRGRERAVVADILPDTVAVRLLGTRTRYEVSWRGIFDYAAKVQAERDRAYNRDLSRLGLSRRAARLAKGGAA